MKSSIYPDRQSRNSLVVLSLFCMPLAVGCFNSEPAGRPARVAASGVVLQNGQPVGGATVVFLPIAHKHAAAATTDDSGRFTLMTFDPGDGAVPGGYQVTIRKVELVPGRANRNSEGGSGEGGEEADSPPPPTEKHLIPEKYASASTSGLQVDVVDGQSNEFSFEL